MAVYKIFVNNKLLKLFKGQTLTTIEESTWFSSEVKADYSFPVSFPADANREALGVHDVLDILPQQRFEIILDQGSKSRDAFLEILEIFDNVIEATIYFNLISLTCLDKNLREVEIPNALPTLQDTYSAGINNIYPNTLVYFPEIFNPGHYEEADKENPKNPDWENIVNQYDPGTELWRINPYDFALLRYKNRNSLAPCPSVLGVLEYFFSLDGFRLVGELVKEDWARRLFTYSNQTIDVQGDLEGWQDLVATDLLGQYYAGPDWQRFNFTDTSSPSNFSTNFNEYSVKGEGDYNFRFTAEMQKTTPFLNNLFMQVLVDSTVVYEETIQLPGQQLINVDFNVDLNFTAADLGKKVYLEIRIGVTTLVRNAVWKIYGTNDLVFIEPSNPTNISNYLPDLKFADYWNEFLKTFNIKPTYDFVRREIHLQFKTEALESGERQKLEGFIHKHRFRFDKPKSLLIYYPESNENRLNNGNDELIYEQFWRVSSEGITIYSEELEVADEKITLAVHPLVRAESNSRITLGVNELCASEPYSNNAAPSPIRYGFYVGFVGGRPSADWQFGNISLVPGRDSRSVLAKLAEWVQLSNREPREVEIILDTYQDTTDADRILQHNNQEFIIREKEVEHGEDMQRIRMLCKKL